MGKRLNEFIRLRAPRRFADLGVGRFGTAIGDVLADGSGKKQRVLQDDRDLRPERFLCDLAHIAAIECDAALSRIIETAARD